MTEPCVFQAKNQKTSPYNTLLLVFFAAFLLTNNFFRLFHSSFFPNHFSLLEAGLYAVACPLYFMKFRKSQWVILSIACSTFYGAILHGISLPSVFYGVKLICLISSSVAIGEVFFKRYLHNIQLFIKTMIWIFFAVTCLGMLIFVCFPNAQLFFIFLQEMGIAFEGDPHQKRFISSFFDPNYYGAIICIPLLLIQNLPQKNRLYSALFSLFLFSLFLTFSRSALATCFFLLLAMQLQKLFSFKRGFSLLELAEMGAKILCVALFFYFYHEEFSHFFHRFSLSQDYSALARWETFTNALSHFWDAPFFGMGYNYLSEPFFQKFHRFSPDSSCLILLINFGFIPCLAFVFASAIFVLHRLKTFTGLHYQVFVWLCGYGGLCIGFTSQFNHLLLYPYWLMPMIVLFTYLDRSFYEVRPHS